MVPQNPQHPQHQQHPQHPQHPNRGPQHPQGQGGGGGHPGGGGGGAGGGGGGKKKKKHRRHKFYKNQQQQNPQYQGLPQDEDLGPVDGQPQAAVPGVPGQPPVPAQPRPTVTGLLEITEKGNGYIRAEVRKFKPVPADPFVPSELIAREQLRMGLMITVELGPRKQGPAPVAVRVTEVNGKPLGDYHQMLAFPDLTVIDPREKVRLETTGGPASMRIMDLLCPIGRGQRGLIVAPPKTGKTTLLKEIAHAALTNHPDMKVFILLIDERPEEVTDFRRSLPAEVWASNADEDVPSHVRTARMVIERAKRMVEFGAHVLVMLDSITRLGRAFNHHVGSSGRTMSGGIDASAMQEPRAMFGAARNIEHGGSLTIIASALIDTGSRMDELIFQEFKGTGNMELVLSKKLAERRVWPAIDLPASGTRKEELLLTPEAVRKVALIRREMLSRDPVQAMEALLFAMRRFPTNEAFLNGFSLAGV